tara:strand:+ start:293 stop:586 length:294 start_codon:yes stop_codon:yes gene_type:complete
MTASKTIDQIIAEVEANIQSEKDLLKQFSFKKGSWFKGYEVKANGYFEGLDFWMVRFEKAGAGWVAFPISERQTTEPKRFETLHEAKINILKNAEAA